MKQASKGFRPRFPCHGVTVRASLHYAAGREIRELLDRFFPSKVPSRTRRPCIYCRIMFPDEVTVDAYHSRAAAVQAALALFPSRRAPSVDHDS